MGKVLTEDQIKREAQEFRCRQALKMLDVPEDIIWKFNGPILFQLAHLCCMIDEPMHWRDALRWIWDHKGELLAHAETTSNEQAITAASKANRTPN